MAGSFERGEYIIRYAEIDSSGVVECGLFVREGKLSSVAIGYTAGTLRVYTTKSGYHVTSILEREFRIDMSWDTSKIIVSST